MGGDTDVLYDTHTTPTAALPKGIIAVRSFELDAFSHDADGQPQPVTHFDKPYTMILGYDGADPPGLPLLVWAQHPPSRRYPGRPIF